MLSNEATKLPQLQPINYAEIVNTNLIKTWLSNPTAKSLWKDAIGDVIDWSDDKNKFKHQDSLLSIIKKPENYKNIDPILLGSAIKSYINTVLSYWKSDSTNSTAAYIVASAPLFVEMSKTLPHVNPSTEYTKAYRGTDVPENKLIRFINANNDPKDWKLVNISGTQYYAYQGPKKNQFVYTPHRPAQSWTVSDKVAVGFGTNMLAAPLDKTFFFDPAFLSQFGFPREKETIHIGKYPMKVILLVPKYEYDKITGRGTKTIDKMNDKDAQYMADKFYNGSVLMYKVDKLMQDKKDVISWYDDNYDKLKGEMSMLGTTMFNKKYTDVLNKLQAMPDLYEATGGVPTLDVPDEEGTLSLPL